MLTDASRTFELLKDYVERERYEGWDPYDGLNSKLFQRIPLLKNSRLARLMWIQFFKKSPLNFRKWVGIHKGANPKGLALFLSGYCNLYKITPTDTCKKTIGEFSEFLISKICKGYSGAAWGYNFDWQARAFFQPTGTPSIVVTSYAGCALLDAYQVTLNPKYLEFARSACNFILKDLNRSYDEHLNFAFSYCPLDQTQVFNASLLGCRLLCRTYAFTKENELLEECKKAIAYVCARQLPDGAWPYSPLPFHQWIDNFHTGFNLECIYTYQQISQDHSFREAWEKGFIYYLDHFFEDDGAPKYYPEKTYPIDLHNTAQLIITLSRTDTFIVHKALIDKVLNWSIEHMFHKQKGYFYYSMWRHITIKIPYMRWTQAWMFFGLSEYLTCVKK